MNGDTLPGANTDAGSDGRAAPFTPARDHMRSQIPAGRAARPEEIAAAAAFLAGDSASYINGALLLVDRGADMRR